MNDINVVLLLELEEEINQGVRLGVPQHEIDMLLRERNEVQRQIDKDQKNVYV